MNFRKYLVILALIMATTLPVLFSDEVSSEQKNDRILISGRIIHSIDKKPIPRARVTIQGTIFSTYSDKNGEFFFGKQLHSLPTRKKATLILYVSLEGFISREVYFEKSQAPLRIEMEPSFIRIGQMEEVVITASGLDKTGYHTPYVTHVVTKDEIFNKDTENINKILLEIPSIAMVGNDHHAAPSIRGLGRKRVVVTVDGIRMPSHRSVGAYLSFINPFNVESLEIIMGPFSTVYGSDAMSGVINVTTKKSSYSGNAFQLNGAIAAGYESVNNGYNYNLSIDGGARNFDFIFTAGKRKAEDYRTGTGERMLDSFYDESYINFKSELLLGRNHRINLLYLRTDGNDIGKMAGDPNKTNKHPHDDHDIVSLNYIWNNINSWFQSLNLSFSRSKYTLTGIFTNIKANKFIETLRALGGDDYTLFLKGKIIASPKLILSLGFDGYFQENQYIRGRKNTYYFQGMTLIDSQELKEIPEASTRDCGLFIQVLYSPTERLSFNFGLREDVISGRVLREDETVRTDLSALNGNIGFVYDLASFMRFAGSIGTAYRVPSIKELYFIGQTPQGINLGNPGLIPERSTNLDFSLKFRVEKPKSLNFAGTIAYFNNTIKNLINLKWNQPTGDRIGVFENIGRAQIHGLELDANLSLEGGWLFSGSFATLEGTDVDSEKILMDIAPVQLNLNLKKYFGKGNYWVGFHVRHSSKETHVAIGDKPTDAFTLFDVLVGGKLIHRAMIRISVINLFDKEYREFFNLANVYCRGRSLQVSIEFKF